MWPLWIRGKHPPGDLYDPGADGYPAECSHHEEGPGQNEIDFRYSDPLTAADNAVTFCSIVKTVAARNGLWADFSPKPLSNRAGSGLHINFSVKGPEGTDPLPHVIAGLLDQAYPLTAFLNPTANSYLRLGSSKAPGYITWSSENRSQLIRIPAAVGEFRRRSCAPPTLGNPYLALPAHPRGTVRHQTGTHSPRPCRL